MSYLRALGCYLPSRVVDNAELAALVNAEPAWILRSTGIEQRRYAAPEETVVSLAVCAARDCLESAGLVDPKADPKTDLKAAKEVSLLIVASGSSERRFPGPAAAIASALGMAGTPAIDLPMASAGSLFGLSLASRLSADYGNVLVIGSEIMSRVVRTDSSGRDTAILFGDGAGACLVGAQTGFARIADSLLASDGQFADALSLDFDSPLHMDGRTIILQASRKIPRAISELLARNNYRPDQIGAYLMHQANLNLITRVAQALEVPPDKFFRNVERYGNTSSASLLIAAAEWWRDRGQPLEAPIVFTAFGAGLHWGALLALPV